MPFSVKVTQNVFTFLTVGRKDLSISIKIKNKYVLQPSNPSPGNLSQRNKHISR